MKTWTTRKVGWILLMIMVLFVIFLYISTLPKFSFGQDADVVLVRNIPNLKCQLKPKMILAYTTLYGTPFISENENFIPKPLTQCECNCVWSTNRTDINRSDAVIFHMYNLSPKYQPGGNMDFVVSNLPTRRNTNQKWILMLREPSAFFYSDQLKLLNNTFNLTVSYMSDSDVRIPYGNSWKLSWVEAAVKLKHDYLSGREKLVLVLISNCVTSSRREDYIHQLKEHIEVDVFGHCGATIEDKHNEIHHLKLTESYKFYLAFENSDCDDYITEKFWSSLMAGIIPVVRGRRANYEKLAPPKSYIHADDFETAQDLARYLKKVASDSAHYNSYHNWRSSHGAVGRFMTSNLDWACDLCRQVHHSTPNTVDVYKQFSEDTRCDTFDRHRDRSGEHMQDIDIYPSSTITT